MFSDRLIITNIKEKILLKLKGAKLLLSMLIHVKVKISSNKERTAPQKNGGYIVELREKAERNQANNRLLEIMREHHPEARMIRIIAGHHTPSKIIEIT